MSSLEQHLTGYLAVRRAMGYKLARAGKLLPQFTDWMAERDQPLITTELALAWATLPPATESNWHRQRLSVVRGFAAHVHALDPAHEVPPADLLPWRPRRAVPYLYSEGEIVALMDGATVIPTPHRAATMRTLIGLLAVTGMRVGEAIRLDRGDVDLASELLTVRDTKFGKSREVALHASTIIALQRYLARRDRPIPLEPTAAVFTSAAGTRLHLLQRAPRVQADRCARRAPPALGDLPASTARPAPHVRCQHAAGRLPHQREPGNHAAAALDLPRARSPRIDVLVSAGRAGTARARRRPPRAPSRRKQPMSSLAPTLQAFFTDRLTRQRNASPHTIAAYRDTLRLLLAFATERTGKQPCQLDIEDLDAPLIGAFLDHLEHERGNSIRTRNARLAAIRSLFHYAALKHPEHADTISRVLAIPPKRFEQALITFLTEPEVQALLAAPDRDTWTGRRDHAMLAARRPDRAARLRAHRPQAQRHSPRHRPARQLPGEGPKAADHAADQTDRRGPANLARGARRAPERPRVPDPHRPGAQPRRAPTTTRQTRQPRLARVPVAGHQDHQPARAPPHRRDATPARRDRHLRDRALARPRTDRDHPDLPPRRHGAQRSRAREDHPARHATRALPATRQAPRLPRSAVIMPTPTRPIRPPPHDLQSPVGITRTSA